VHYDEIVIKNLNERKGGNQINFYMNFHSKYSLGVDFTACSGGLLQETSCTSFD